jgi:hypothetical protein
LLCDCFMQAACDDDRRVLKKGPAFVEGKLVGVRASVRLRCRVVRCVVWAGE